MWDLVKIVFLTLALPIAVVQAAIESPDEKKIQTGADYLKPVIPHIFKGDLRNLPRPRIWKPGDPIKEIPKRRRPPKTTIDHDTRVTDIDPLLAGQQKAAPSQSDRVFSVPTLNFDGQGFTGANPPDTVGDVGTNYYIQMINGGGGALVIIYNKTDGSVAAGPFALESLGSGNCASGLGDPVVLFDELADRWLLSEFSDGSNDLCVYVSQGPDPVTDGFFAYEFLPPTFPDYPKYAVWPDAYYVSANEGPAVYALDRNQMLIGGDASLQRFTHSALSGFGFQATIPADHDGGPAGLDPLAGAPAYFMRHRDDEVHSGTTDPSNDFLEIWEFQVDFATPANSTFSQTLDIPVSDFDSNLCGLTSFSCFPQPGSLTQLDPLREVIMWRLQYRNFGTHETLVGNLVTDVDGTDRGGIRWFELRKSGASPWSLFQEGTYSPDATNRWMGAISMDGSGNIAVGYNVSDGNSVFPGIRYAGRLSVDSIGTLPQGEFTIVNGSVANASNRYGDYSAMSVDPIDGCTFWFTGQYNPASMWSTRVSSFRFDTCTGAFTPDFTLSSSSDLTPSACSGDNVLTTVDVGEIGGFNNDVTLSYVGLPAGFIGNFSVNPITPPGSSDASVNIGAGVFSGTYSFDIHGSATGGTDKSLTVEVDVFDAPPAGAVTLQNPTNATEQSTTPTFQWTAAAADMYRIDIAQDAAFTVIVDSAVVTGTSYTPTTALSPGVQHFWRIIAINPCGSSSPSGTFSFTTTLEFCSDPGFAIPENDPAGVTDTIVITAPGNIDDLDVQIIATHTWVGDLDVTVQHVDTGTSVTIIDRPGVPDTLFGCSLDNIDAILDDEGTSGAVEDVCPPIGGLDYTPNNPLDAFDGESIAGTWILTVVDNFPQDNGTLDSWCLFAPPPTANGIHLPPWRYHIYRQGP